MPACVSALGLSGKTAGRSGLWQHNPQGRLKISPVPAVQGAGSIARLYLAICLSCNRTTSTVGLREKAKECRQGQGTHAPSGDKRRERQTTKPKNEDRVATGQLLDISSRMLQVLSIHLILFKNSFLWQLSQTPLSGFHLPF